MPFVPVGFAVFSTRVPSARDLDVRTRLSSGCSALQSFFRPGRSGGFHRRTPALSFGSLQHIEETRSRPFAGIQSRSLRLQGLATLVACCSPRVPAGFVSPRRRSWDSPFEAFPLLRVSRHSCREAPTCRSLFWLPFQWDGIPLERPPAPTTGFRPRNKSLVFDDPEGPPQTGCSLGFSPF
jgi:hypothetical protein